MHGWPLLKRTNTVIIIVVVVDAVVIVFENSLTWSIAPAQNLP